MALHSAGASTTTRRVHRLPRLLLTLPLLAACAPVTRTGIGPLVTDRPDFTESMETVPVSMRQLEFGTTVSNTADESSASLGEFLLRVGMTPRTELRVGLNSYTLSRAAGETQTGFEDVSLGAKIKFADGGGDGSIRPALAVIVGSTLPTGAPGIRATRAQPEVKFGASWDISSRVSFATNLNAAYVRDDFGDHAEYATSGSLGVALSDRVGSFVEYFNSLPGGVQARNAHYVNGGLTYGFTDNLQLDIRSGVGLHRTMRKDVFFGVGVSRRW